MRTLTESWLHGKYTVGNYKIEINTSLPYLSIEGEGMNDFFVQDDEAQKIISEMHRLWVRSKMTVERVIEIWIQNNL